MTNRKHQKRGYTGPQVEYNPNLPPAAFPTLDHPSQVNHSDNKPRSPSPLGLHTTQVTDSAIEKMTDPWTQGNGTLDLDRQLHAASSSKDGKSKSGRAAKSKSGRKSAAVGGNSATESSITVDRRLVPGSRDPFLTEEDPSELSELPNPIWDENMRLMQKWGNMNDDDRFMKEMETSDEDTVPIPGRSKTPGKGFAPGDPNRPRWDDLSIASRHDLIDAVHNTQTDKSAEWVMEKLRLTTPEKEEMMELLLRRQEREDREDEDIKNFQSATRSLMGQKSSVSTSEVQAIAAQTLYGTVGEEDHRLTTPQQIAKAKAYLAFCALDPELMVDRFDLPSILPKTAAVGSHSSSKDRNASGSNHGQKKSERSIAKSTSQYAAPKSLEQQPPYHPRDQLPLTPAHTPQSQLLDLPHNANMSTMNLIGSPPGAWPQAFRKAYGEPLPESSSSFNPYASPKSQTTPFNGGRLEPLNHGTAQAPAPSSTTITPPTELPVPKPRKTRKTPAAKHSESDEGSGDAGKKKKSKKNALPAAPKSSRAANPTTKKNSVGEKKSAPSIYKDTGSSEKVHLAGAAAPQREEDNGTAATDTIMTE